MSQFLCPQDVCASTMLNARYVGSQKLSEMLQQPYDLYKAGWADAYLMGLINQVFHHSYKQLQSLFK